MIPKVISIMGLQFWKASSQELAKNLPRTRQELAKNLPRAKKTFTDAKKRRAAVHPPQGDLFVLFSRLASEAASSLYIIPYTELQLLEPDSA